MSPSRLEMQKRAAAAGVWNKNSGISYSEHCRLAVTDTIARGHTDPASLRKIVIWTTNTETAPTAEAYFEKHRADPELLKALVAIAMEGDDGGDCPWAAANVIADYPGAMLIAHKNDLQAIARELWAYLHVPARKALTKIAAIERASSTGHETESP